MAPTKRTAAQKKVTADKRRRLKMASQRLRRQDPLFREEEQNRNTASHRQARLCEQRRLSEQERDTFAHMLARQDVERRLVEQQRDTFAHKLAHRDEDHRLVEQHRDTFAHRLARQHGDHRLVEQQRDTFAHRLARQDEVRRLVEQQRDTFAHRLARQDGDHRIVEQQRDTFAHRFARQDGDRRLVEQQRDTFAHRLARQDLERRLVEQQRDTFAHRLARQDEERRLVEQQRDTKAHKLVRKNEERRIAEQEHNSEAHRRGREINHSVWLNVVSNFEITIKEGPTVSCNCCGGLWFSRSIRTMSLQQLQTKSEDYLTLLGFVLSSTNTYNLCGTCYASVKRSSVPRLCLSNGLSFPTVPLEVSQLTRLEARLISARHVFQSIWTVYGVHGQYRTKGRIVNVPVSVDTTVSCLPRLPNQDDTIHIRLARQIHIEKNYTSGNIRPNYIWNAAYCLSFSPLYQEYGITLSSNWIEEIEKALTHLEESEATETISVDDFEFQADDHIELNLGGIETLVSGEEGIRMAPAQGYRPLSILFDKDSPYLAFPTLFGGQRLMATHVVNNKELSKSELYKSIIRRSDRRAAESTEFILFAAKVLEIDRITSNHTICPRKRKNNRQQTVTAQQIADKEYVDGLVRDDNAFRVLQGIRNSAHHWHQEGMRVRAMVRQFGLPHIFLTISAAEIKWPELIVILKKMLDNENITEEQTTLISDQERATLIQRDPVTCARYFDNRFHALMKTFKSDQGPFFNRQILHYFYRVEFQHRGSPHVHMIMWLSNAPTYVAGDEASNIESCKFIDEIVTCTIKYDDTDSIHQLLLLNTHRHTQTCRKKSKRGIKCRFGIPFFPMDKTRILTPLTPNDDESAHLRCEYKRIRTYLETDAPLSLSSFDEFLKGIKISFEDYLKIIRSSLTKDKIFISRTPCEIFINNYNEKIFRLNRANMDIQFILDGYACCCYIIDYINKSEKGMSDIMQKILEETRSGNVNLSNRLRSLGAAFHQNSELSAQEASYNILSIPMSKSSEQCIFIPTGPPEERNRILMSEKQILELAERDPSSTEIYVAGLIEHYEQRPDELENITLSYFSAWYDFCKTMRNASPTAAENDNRQIEAETYVSSHLKLKDNSGFIKKRSFPKVIRFRRFTAIQDRNNYFREMIMLYLPWRRENCDLTDCEEKYKTNVELISKNRTDFNAFDDEFLENEMRNAGEGHDDRVDFDDYDDHRPDHDEFPRYVLDDGSGQVEDFGTYEAAKYAEKFLVPNRVPDVEFHNLISSLNDEQRDFVTDVVSHFQNNPIEPIYYYLKGGAGVGKSHVINTIYQALIRIFNSDINSNPDKTSILLTANSGKAAFNIHGNTLHTAFQLPVNSHTAHELSASVANSMSTALSTLKLVIIDEISMVGEQLLRMVDKRLRDIFNRDKIFGGISLIAVGDFYQLPPVLASSLMSSKSSDPFVEILQIPLWHNFQVYELTTIMRQREDIALALNNLAKGTMTPTDVSLMSSRTFPTLSPDVVRLKPINLFWRNKDVDDFNNAALQSISGDSAISKAADTTFGGGTASGRRAILEQVLRPTVKLSDTMGLVQSLRLKVGARYMITSNIDCSDGLVNGAVGILRLIDRGINRNNPAMTKPLRIWIVFESSRSGKLMRQKNQALITNRGINSSWTPIEPIALSIKRKKNSNLQVIRKQFPIVPAEAMTIHKSQGSTYIHVAVHLDPGLTTSLLYVACSRATTAAGLFLIGTFKKTSPRPLTHPLTIEMNRHKSITILPRFLHLRSAHVNSYQIIFHNVQSLHKHWPIYASDSIYINSEIILMAETWTLVGDIPNIPGHVLISTVDSTPHRNPIGSRCYLQECLTLYVSSVYSDLTTDMNGSVSISGFIFRDILILSIYRSPKCSLKTLQNSLIRAISQHPTTRIVIAGDFNIDILSSKRNELLSIMDKLGLQLTSLSVPTTRHGTQLDAFFTNFETNSTGLYVSFTSIHEPIWLKFLT